MNEIKGYKGFDENLKCINFQYEIGKTYAIERKDLKVCSKGFHFCKDLNDVDSFYAFDRDKMNKNDIKLLGAHNGTPPHRYCEIEVLGEVQEHRTKCVTDIIKIVRELTQVEIIEIRNKKYWDAAFELQQQIPNLLIGGSMGLIIDGLMEENTRVFHDIDVVVPHYLTLDLPHFQKTDREGGPFSGGNQELQTTSNVSFNSFYKEIPIDFFINTNTKHKQIVFKDKKWNITNSYKTLQAKLDYINCSSPSSRKHLKDLCDIFGKLNKKHFPNSNKLSGEFNLLSGEFILSQGMCVTNSNQNKTTF